MNYYLKYKEYSPAKFLRLTGLSKDKFEELIPLFLDYIDKHWETRGRKGKFTLIDKCESYSQNTTITKQR
jgi:hypothetical protein